MKYSSSKLAKAIKRKANHLDDFEKRPSKRQAMNIENCMFREKGTEEGDLHQVLTFDNDANIRQMITELQDTQILAQFSEDVLILTKAAEVIRNDIFNHEHFEFSGSFSLNCQENSLPSSLKTLISLIFNVSNMKNQERQESQACLSIGQLIIYNTKKSSPCGMKMRHTLDREPPLPIYIGLNLHHTNKQEARN